MEKKKSDKANLENSYTTRILIALVIVFWSLLAVFEWETPVKKESALDLGPIDNVEEELIPITRQEKKKVEPPKPLPQINIIDIVANDEEDVPDLEIKDIDINQDTEIEPIAKVEEEDEQTDEKQIFVIAEEMPIFMPKVNKTKEEGDKALYEYINKNVRYPTIAQENGIVGKVFVGFVVNQDGRVANVTIARSPDETLSKAAKKVVENLPKFRPAMQRGRAVRVKYSVIVNFQLQ